MELLASPIASASPAKAGPVLIDLISSIPLAQALEHANRLSEAEDFMTRALIMLAKATAATGAAHPAVEPTAVALMALFRKRGMSETVALERVNEIQSSHAEANLVLSKSKHLPLTDQIRAFKSLFRRTVQRSDKRLPSGEIPVIMGWDDTLLLFSKTGDGIQLRARADDDPATVDLNWQIVATPECPREMRQKTADWLKNSNDERALKHLVVGLSSKDGFIRRASAHGVIQTDRASVVQEKRAQQVIDQMGK